jgi:hypothetical protein
MKYANILCARVFIVAATFAGFLPLTGCTPVTSAERHARHFIYASDDGFDPNFSVRKADSTRMMVPFFTQFWLMGKSDRQAGLTAEQAAKRASELGSDEFLNAIQRQAEFAGKIYNHSASSSLRWRKAASAAISGSYLDGYQGKP